MTLNDPVLSDYRHTGCFAASASALAHDGSWSLADVGLAFEGWFSLQLSSPDVVVLNHAGLYRVELNVTNVRSTDTTDPKQIQTALRINSVGNVATAQSLRGSAADTDWVSQHI